MTLPDDQPPFLKKLRALVAPEELRKGPIVKITLAVVVVFLVTLMFPHGESIEYVYPVGAVWADKDLLAPFSFPILKDYRTYEKERQTAAAEIYPVFRKNESIGGTQQESLLTIFKHIQAILEIRNRLRSITHADSVTLVAEMKGIPFDLTSQDWRALAKLQNGRSPIPVTLAKLSHVLSTSLGEVLRAGIINQHKARQLRGAIALRQGSMESIVSTGKIYDYDSAISSIEKNLDSSVNDEAAREIAAKIVRSVLRPNILFDETETSRSAQAAADDVPRSIGFVQQNELVISKNQVITEETRLKLESYQHARRDRGIESQEWRHWVGITIHVVLVLGLFTLYLYLFRKQIFNDSSKLAIIALLILLETFITALSVNLPFTGPVQYLICIPVASMLLAIIFDSRVAFYATVTLAFLIAAMRGNDYSIGLVSLVAGAFSAYTVRDISHRTQIFRSIIFIFLGYALPILALSIQQFEPLNSVGTALAYSFANAVISPVLTYAFLLFFERVFKITTDLTLVELSDLSHPLLQELSDKAPGTFHHSVTIGNLAEAAAEAIGANAVLAKVGGYYHDIGKIVKPEYFVENQVSGHNRHNRLRPRMSALIIASHVKEGVELGRERRLPEQIIDFIPQHHGTNRISFFYDKALRQATKRPSKETINEEDFRYPGPKPQSKETGIVMLADSVEASTRALNEMTPQSLDRAIDNMIKHRFLEGQLDDCELTLRDLSLIREAFLQILIGIHHHRIKYPDQMNEQPAEDHIAEPPPPRPQPEMPHPEAMQVSPETPLPEVIPPIGQSVDRLRDGETTDTGQSA